MSVITLAGSASRDSRSSALLEYLGRRLEAAGVSVDSISLRDIPAQELIDVRLGSPATKIVRSKIRYADALIVATPVYKASLSGGLKAMLDLLPEQALADKVVLPIATGGSSAHLLAIEYGLKPVLSALGARHILAGVYASDSQVFSDPDNKLVIAPEVLARLDEALADLLERLVIRSHAHASPLARAEDRNVVPILSRASL
jgi:FMN reductase